jgi:hypothetical protein
MDAFVSLLLLPALFAAPPEIPVKVSKETTFITEPLAVPVKGTTSDD